MSDSHKQKYYEYKKKYLQLQNIINKHKNKINSKSFKGGTSTTTNIQAHIEETHQKDDRYNHPEIFFNNNFEEFLEGYDEAYNPNGNPYESPEIGGQVLKYTPITEDHKDLYIYLYKATDSFKENILKRILSTEDENIKKNEDMITNIIPTLTSDQQTRLFSENNTIIEDVLTLLDIHLGKNEYTIIRRYISHKDYNSDFFDEAQLNSIPRDNEQVGQALQFPKNLFIEAPYETPGDGLRCLWYAIYGNSIDVVKKMKDTEKYFTEGHSKIILTDTEKQELKGDCNKMRNDNHISLIAEYENYLQKEQGPILILVYDVNNNPDNYNFIQFPPLLEELPKFKNVHFIMNKNYHFSKLKILNLKKLEELYIINMGRIIQKNIEARLKNVELEEKEREKLEEELTRIKKLIAEYNSLPEYVEKDALEVVAANQEVKLEGEKGQTTEVKLKGEKVQTTDPEVSVGRVATDQEVVQEIKNTIENQITYSNVTKQITDSNVTKQIAVETEPEATVDKGNRIKEGEELFEKEVLKLAMGDFSRNIDELTKEDLIEVLKIVIEDQKKLLEKAIRDRQNKRDNNDRELYEAGNTAVIEAENKVQKLHNDFKLDELHNMEGLIDIADNALRQIEGPKVNLTGRLNTVKNHYYTIIGIKNSLETYETQSKKIVEDTIVKIRNKLNTNNNKTQFTKQEVIKNFNIEQYAVDNLLLRQNYSKKSIKDYINDLKIDKSKLKLYPDLKKIIEKYKILEELKLHIKFKDVDIEKSIETEQRTFLEFFKNFLN